MSNEKKVTRREFIQQTGAATVGIACAGALGATMFGCDPDQGATDCPDPQDPAAPRPNILLITTDQESQTHWFKKPGLSDQENEQWVNSRLPARAWLKQHGVEFTSAHCNALPCSPSRSSIYSGLYPHQHQVYGNTGMDAYGFTEWVSAPSGPPLPTNAWPDHQCWDSPGIPGEAKIEDVEFTEAALHWLQSDSARNPNRDPWYAVFSLV